MAPLAPFSRARSTTSKRTAAKPKVRFAHKSKSATTRPSALASTPVTKDDRSQVSSERETEPSSSIPAPTDDAITDDFSTWLERASKKDKRIMRHSLLVAQAKASAQATGRISKGRGAVKRRRPQNKLRGADMNDMADALAGVVADGETKKQERHQRKTKRASEISEATSKSSVASSKPSASHSLYPKRGVHKRKEAINRLERARFTQNMAQFLSAKSAPSPSTATSAHTDARTLRNAKWQALQAHIIQNLNSKTG